MVADGHKNVARARSDGLRRKFGFQLQIELVHFHLGRAAAVGAALGNGEDNKEQNGKSSARHGGHGLGEKIGDGYEKQRQSDEAQADRNLNAANMEIKRNLEFALAGPGVAEDENGQPVHRETPDHAEGIQVCQKSHVAAADEDGEDLKPDDDIDNAVAGAESRMGLAEPRAENSVLGDTIEDAVRTDDGGID